MKEMKRSNNTIFKYTMILGAAMSLSACNGLFENIYDAPTETEMEIKENSFSQIKTVEYTEWAYIDFSGRKVTTVKIGKEYESEIPDNWDIAIHRYDIKTNEGAAYQTSYTSFDALKANGKLPDDKDFVKDEWTTDKIAIDMSGMMEGNIVYTDSYYNSVLSTWLNVDTSTMPPIYTMSNQVYLIRLKDNTYAAIRFTNYTNAKGIKGYIDFDFLYPFDFEKITKKTITKNETYIYNITISFIATCSTFAQQSSNYVSGRVTDTNGEPLPGATISIKGKGTGAVTTSDGTYTLQLPGTGSYIITASYVGYQTVEKKFTTDENKN